MAGGLTLLEKTGGIARAYPSYRVEISKVSTGIVYDVTYAVKHITIEQNLGYRAGHAKIAAEYGKNLDPGKALLAAEAGDTVRIYQVAMHHDPILFTGKLDNPRRSIDGPVVRAEFDARDATKELQCHQVDLVMTGPQTVSDVVEDLFATNMPEQARSIATSTFMVEPIQYRGKSMHDILVYLEFISGERYRIDPDGTFVWEKPNKTIPKVLTTLLPDPTIDKSSWDLNRDATRLVNVVHVVSDGNKSNPREHVYVGDGVTRFFPLPYKPADPILTNGGLIAKVVDRFTAEERELTLGVEYKESLDGESDVIPAIVTPSLRLPQGASLSSGVAIPPGGFASDPYSHVDGIEIVVGSSSGAGTGGKGAAHEALVQVMPSTGTVGIRLSSAPTWHQELVVSYRSHTPQTVTITDTGSVAKYGRAEQTLSGPRFQSASQAMQVAAAHLADLSTPVIRGHATTNLVNDEDILGAIGKLVRVEVPEDGVSDALVVTGRKIEWLDGEVVTHRISFGPPDQDWGLPKLLRDHEEALQAVEGTMKTEATT